jgi:hypothetical protein
VPRETPSPIDLPEPQVDPTSALGWTAVVIAVAAVLLLALNAVSLRDWVDDQPPSPVQARAAAVADQWLAITAAIGLAGPRDALHDRWKQAEAARFPDASAQR